MADAVRWGRGHGTSCLTPASHTGGGLGRRSRTPLGWTPETSERSPRARTCSWALSARAGHCHAVGAASNLLADVAEAVVSDGYRCSRGRRSTGIAGPVSREARLRVDTRALRGAHRCREYRRATLRRTASPGPQPALRPALRDRRGAGLLGRAQGTHPGPVRTTDGGPRRGPSRGVRRLRGSDPEG